MAMRGWVLVGVLGCAAVSVAGAGAQESERMAKGEHPSFEVATIKLSDPDSHRQGIGYEGHRVTATGQTLKSLMMFAYGVHGKQIADAPGWVATEKYDIAGVADVPGEPDLKQMQEIYQKLLAERFGLKLRREKREMGYYSLTVAKGGAKLAKAKDGDDAVPDQTGNGGEKGMDMVFTANRMEEFALGMNYWTAEPIVDETGLVGRYDFRLRWMPDSLADAAAGMKTGEQVPALFTAVQEQLGLKLESKHGPVEVLAVEKVERPSAN